MHLKPSKVYEHYGWFASIFDWLNNILPRKKDLGKLKSESKICIYKYKYPKYKYINEILHTYTYTYANLYIPYIKLFENTGQLKNM